MNKLLKKFLLVAVAGLLSFGLFACNNNDEKPTPGPGPDTGKDPVEEQGFISVEDYKAYTLLDLADVLASVGDLNKLSAEGKAAVEAAYNAGKAAVEAAKSNSEAYSAFKAAKAAIIDAIPQANGIQSFLSLSNAERTEILGLLEGYAVRNGITGISLYENGGYVMYNERIQLGTENYITGYGFGILTEGDITAPLPADIEANEKYQWYYHTYDISDPGHANALDDKGSQVSDVYSYIAGSFFTTFMNADKNGYDWVPELAMEKPQAVNAAEDGTATKWRFQVRTDVKYSTNSKDPERAAFNDRQIELEDYLTPFKLLLTKANGYERGAEMASTTTGAIKGAQQYFNNSAAGFNAEAWEEVGLKVYEEEGKSYFEFEYTQPTTQFYAMYYITSNLNQPLPQSFIDLVGVDNYLRYNSDKSLTPVDNSLSLGSYVLEAWDTDKLIAFSKNPNYVYAEDYYKIKGIHMAILPGAQEDPNLAFEEFLAGKLDSSGIPQEYLDQYKNDTRTKTTTGSSNFKLNVNATDAKTWEYLFGEKGVVCRTEKSDYWTVEPALSNPHFVKALSLSIDRLTFASARGSVGSVNYLSSAYMSDPENNISYNASNAHKNAVASLLRDTDGNGYSLENAREYFKLALEELVADEHYVAGTAENPTVIELQVAWMYTSQETTYHKEIEQYLETAFNHESVHGNKFKLDVQFWVGSQWSDVYYNKMMRGQFDIGFGAISGNTLNPLDFVGVLSSDQNISGELTLNWGTNTNDAKADVLVYNGVQWSFDALWKAANATALVENGALISPFGGALVEDAVDNGDGTWTISVGLNINNGEGYSCKLDSVVLYYYDLGFQYNEFDVTERAEVVVNEAGVTIATITLTAEEVQNLVAFWTIDDDGDGFSDYYNSGYTGLDFCYTEQIVGYDATEGVKSIGAEKFLPQELADAE